MTPQEFLDEFGTLAESAQGVPKLRELILELAVRGKLVEQDESEGTAEAILEIASKANSTGEPSPRIADDETPFDLPSQWRWSRLGDWLDVNWGDTSITKKSFVDSGVVAYSAAGPDGFLEHADFNCDGVVISAIGARCGRCFLASGEWTSIKNTMTVVEHAPQTACLSLVYRIGSRPDTFPRRGGAQPFLSLKDVRATLVPVPPLAEQHRIVSKVDELMGLCDRLEAVQGERRGVRVRLNRSSLDRLTSVSTARGGAMSAAWQRVCDHFEVLYDTPETLPDLRQTILQLAVQGKLVPQDPNDEPVDLLLEKLNARREKLIANGDLKKSKIAPLTDEDIDITVPDHWKWSRLNDLVEVMNSGWSPACEPNPTSDESEWGVLKTTSVQSFAFWEHEHKRLPDNLEPRPEAEAKSGDLLMTRAGPQNRVGISCLVREVRPRLMISDKIIRFHLIEPFMYDEFVALCLNAGVSQEHIEKSKSGMAASQMNISQTKFRMTPIPVPPRAEQKRIVSKVTHLLSQVTRLELTLTRRETTRTQLLTAAIHSMLEK